jgi:hypothetical protein
VSPAKLKRIKKCLRLFDYHVTHQEDCGCRSLCHGDGHSCLQRSLKQLNNLTGLNLTVERVFAVGNAAFNKLENWTASTQFTVSWVIGQYEREAR